VEDSHILSIREPHSQLARLVEETAVGTWKVQ